ncbi:MAG: DNA primase [Patescibacteria group bacterium]
MSDTVDRIKERLSITEVVQPYVKLTRAGKYWKGLSPFTKEKTPSFFVTPDRGIFHCFSSGKGGDMFTFIEEMEGVDFRGALKLLAEKAGVELVREAPGARDEREQVYAALDAARAYYESVLVERPDVQDYLVKRQITKELAGSWSLGYAPNEWHALRETLLKQGFSEMTMESAGLIKTSEEDARKKYDRFRGRIMFPIRDVSGRVIGFSGRIFEEDPKHPGAKYINSPEGPVFDKSRALYGIHEAKNKIRELGFAMLVEGQVDLLMAHSLGYKSAVATSGTAFTPAHADVLKRYSSNLLIAYDGDKAGIAAAGRAAAVALPRGMNVKVVSLPPGMDPADLIGKDPAAFKEAVKKAVPVPEFFLEVARRSARDQRQFKLEVGKTVLPYVALIENRIDQAHFVSAIASALQVPQAAVQSELKKLGTQGVEVEKGAKDPYFWIDQGERFIYGILRILEDTKDVHAALATSIFESNFGLSRLEEMRGMQEHEEEAARILASENFFALNEDTASQGVVLEDMLREAERRAKRSAYGDLQARLKVAASAGDAREEASLMAALTSLAKELEN